MKNSILILANSDVGLYKFRKELVEKLIEKDYKVYISVPNGQYIGKFKDLGCEYINTPINRRGINPLKDLKLLFKYISLTKKLNPNVVLTYTIKPNVYGGVACGLLKIPYIANITGLGTSIENEGIIKKVSLLLYKISLKKAKCVFFQNKTNKKFFVNEKIVENNKTRLIPGSGVNLERYSFEEYPKNDNIIKFLFIGRLMKAKGILELFEAAKKIKAKYSHVQFNFIGRSEEDHELLIKELEKNEIINYHGQQNDVHSFIKSSHAVINPSHHEGMSNVLLEAASTGRPVIASNIPGCRETFDENVSGIGFEVKNVNSLVQAISRFVELPYEEKKRMGIAGRRKVENEFDRNFVIDAYIEEIEKIIGR